MEKKSIEVGFLLVFPIFFLEKAFAHELFTCILQRMVRNTFLARKLIVHILSPERTRDRFFLKKLKKKMAMSSEDKDKEQMEEQAAWAKLCSKLVSNNVYIL